MSKGAKDTFGSSLREEPDYHATSTTTTNVGQRKTLPIDEHAGSILKNIQNNRVTIIHGETGCGKSSRVPIMLLQSPSPEPSLPKVKFFISQPRRIAAKGLVERIRSCEPDFRDKFALRMGHGWREYETGQTQAWFVTTGYLTRLLANHSERLDDCTHLVIDEVHERSVDTDILCLLCRRLLERNKKIRLVLMSATLATKLYKEYFNVPTEPIHVGVRTFPITEYFVEDLNQFKLPRKEANAIHAITEECQKKQCNSAPTPTELTKRFSLAAHLAKAVGRPGSSVLIFVPGMNEIVSITECIEDFHVAGIRYTCCPIHSDIPFEDQMDAFNDSGADEVKIIIATNAAESSVTLPNVDHVICLGLCRQILYNPASHRQILSPCWISRASATQRAGRTGRVRPGSVYRLYTRSAFETFMEEFDRGEIRRVPLDSVILMLKEMLHEEVIPVLESCIEPPELDNIDRSLQSLHRWKFIQTPDDKADITSLGSFVTALGIDLSLGSMIGLGIQFGVAAEAVEMAAVMSFSKTPFQMTSQLFHSSAKFNEITSATFLSKCHFDANLYSEPMALMNALWDYQMARNQMKWSLHYRIAIARMKQLYNTRNSLRRSVADFFGIDEDKLVLENPPVHMPHAKIVILRLLQVWVFSETIVVARPSKLVQLNGGAVSLSLQNGEERLERSHLNQVLTPSRHPYEICYIGKKNQNVYSEHHEHEGPFSLVQFASGFEERLVSYMIETKIDLACCYDSNNFYLLTNDEKSYGSHVSILFDSLQKRAASASSILAFSNPSEKGRGDVLERKCGKWSVKVDGDEESRRAPEGADSKYFRRHHVTLDVWESGGQFCAHMNDALHGGEVTSVLFWQFMPQDSPLTVVSLIRALGECQEVSKIDLQDLLGAHEVLSLTSHGETTHIRFLPKNNTPLMYNGNGKELFATTHVTETSSWNRPLLNDVSEGARLLSVLASSDRKGGQKMRFSKKKKFGNPEDTVDCSLKETNVARRWQRLGAAGAVFVPENAVPASAVNTQGPLFACCSNALEINGGRLRVDGMTLLPPNPLFLLLSMLSFGLDPDKVDQRHPLQHIEEDDDIGEQRKVRVAMSWLEQVQKSPIDSDCDDEQVQKSPADSNSDDIIKWADGIDAKERIQTAMSFHDSALDMGESLVCVPEKILELCNLFSFVDGYEVTPWDSLGDKAFTEMNLARWRKERKPRSSTLSTSRKGGRIKNDLQRKATQTKSSNFKMKESGNKQQNWRKEGRPGNGRPRKGNPRSGGKGESRWGNLL